MDAVPEGLVAAQPARVPEDGATFAVALLSNHGRLLASNRAFLRLFRYDSFGSMRAKSFPRDVLRHASDWMRWWSNAASRSGFLEVSAECVGADQQPVAVRGAVERIRLPRGEEALRIVLIDESVTTRFRELSVRTARVEAALSLAAGVSHDFNNLLTVLVGNLYLVSEHLRGDAAVHAKLRSARDAAKRGAGLARQLVEIARGAGTDSVPVAVDLGALLRSLAPLLTSVVGSRVTFRAQVRGEMLRVFADRAQLESVITNLVMNARDAVAEVLDGHILLSVERRVLSKAASASRSIPAGNYAVLSVRDNGCGIPKEIADRVFEPFFSTKPSGRGTGLGLSMVRWFAEKSGGSVSFASQPGGGTEVAVLLPAHDVDQVENTISTVALGSLPGGSERVAVVSDDPDFRATVGEMLSALGYAVAADTPVLSASAPSVVVIDAAATSASKVAIALHEKGAARVVVVGDPGPRVPSATLSVPKPFTPTDLARAVRAALEE